MILLDYVLLYLYFGLRGYDSSAQDDEVCEDLNS